MFSATPQRGNYSPNMRRCMLVMGLNDPQATNTTCLLELIVDQTCRTSVRHTHHNTATNINCNILSQNIGDCMVRPLLFRDQISTNLLWPKPNQTEPDTGYSHSLDCS